MKDLSLVLCPFSLVLGSCSADSKFATFLSVFATQLQRYEEFLNYTIFFAIIFQKIAKKYPSRGEWQFPRERAATSLHFISKQATGALVILSLLFHVLVYGTLSPILSSKHSSIHLFNQDRKVFRVGKARRSQGLQTLKRNFLILYIL